MTNKRKQRSRKLSAKSGMSYQAANNVVTKDLPRVVEQPRTEVLRDLQALNSGYSPEYRDIRTEPSPLKETLNKELAALGLVPEEVKKATNTIGVRGLPHPPNNPHLEDECKVELPPLPEYLQVFTDIGDSPFTEDYFSAENKRRRELRGEILLKLRDETRAEAFRKGKETGDMLQAEKERIMDMKQKILSDAMEAIRVLDERRNVLETLVNPPPPPVPSGLDSN